MRRRFGRGSVLLGLVLLHGLADVAVGLYRTHDINRELTDLLAGALSRSQICLLALWLAAGFERLSWRICGLLGGSSFVFVVFSRTVFPGQTDIKTGNPWLEQEWEYYFRSSGPGDFLVRLPILIVDVAGPLLVWRAWRAIRLVRAGSRAIQFGWEWLQFRLHDAAVWTTTICVVAVAIFQTTPYPEWFSELQKRWVQYYQFQDRAALYHLLSSADYVLVALASLGVAYGTVRWKFCVTLSIALALGTASGLEHWLRKSNPSFWTQSPSEALVSGVAATAILVTLLLYKVYWPTLSNAED